MHTISKRDTISQHLLKNIGSILFFFYSNAYIIIHEANYNVGLDLSSLIIASSFKLNQPTIQGIVRFKVSINKPKKLP